MNLFLARAQVEKLAGTSLEERDSTYQGGVYYFHGDNSSEHFVLKKNIDPFDGEPVEQAFSDYPILFYVNATNRSRELMAVDNSTYGVSGLTNFNHAEQKLMSYFQNEYSSSKENISIDVENT